MDISLVKKGYNKKSIIKSLFQKSVLKNINFTAKSIGIMFIATSAVNLINFFYHVIMGRLLGPSEYGVLTSIISFLFITAAITGTIRTTSAKYASVYLAEGNLGKIRDFFFSITKRLLVFTVVIFIIIIAFLNKMISFLKIDSIYPIIFLGVMIIEGSLVSIGRGTLQGIKKFRSLGIISVLEVLLKLILGIILVYFGFKASGAIFGFMLATLLSYFFIFIPLRRVLIKREDNIVDSKIDIKGFYKSILFILISTVLFSLLSYTDIILVKHFFSSRETGFYSAAAQIGRIILFFPGAVGIVIFPRLSEKYTKKENINITFFKGSAIIAVISVVFLIVYYFFPEFLMNLIYGSKYLVASGLIFRYGIFMTFISLITLQIFYFISIGKYWYLIYSFFILIEQITLIWIYHNNLGLILLILIINSFVLFLLNLLLIIFYSRKTKNKNYETGKNLSINTGL